jgi:hypothetical protein
VQDDGRIGRDREGSCRALIQLLYRQVVRTKENIEISWKSFECQVGKASQCLVLLLVKPVLKCI